MVPGYPPEGWVQDAALRDITEELVTVRSACQSLYSDTECLPLDGAAHHRLQNAAASIALGTSSAPVLRGGYQEGYAL